MVGIHLIEASSIGQDPSEEVREWAASTTRAWANEVKKDWSREKMRQRSARFRVLKSSELIQLRSERDRLNKTLKQLLVDLSSTAVNRKHTAASPHLVRLRNEVYRLVLESDIVRNSNIELYWKLQQHERFWSLAMDASLHADVASGYDVDTLSLREESKKSTSVANWKQQKLSEWRVRFPNGEPSFYFHPFTRADVNAVIESSEEFLATNPVSTKAMGVMFGWTMHCAPLTQGLNRDDLLAHARLTTHGYFSLDDVDAMITASSISSLPPLAPPLNPGRSLTRACTQVLQEFDRDTHVLVCNIPGRTHIRYMFVARRLSAIEENGKRSLTFILAIANSKTNARCCGEDQRHDVQWVDEGGHYIKFTEVNYRLVEVTEHQWARCESELHAEHLYIRWAQNAYQAAEKVTPLKLHL